MDLQKYEMDVSADFLTYKFVSNGTNGAIDKAIKYRPIKSSIVHNLAFGDVIGIDEITGEIYIDDLVESNNGDRDKILATVASSAYIFSGVYPHKPLLIRGSNPARTRLYRMSINKYYEEISKSFDIFGGTYVGEVLTPCPYLPNETYAGFFLKRK